jgi:hypothetical protein
VTGYLTRVLIIMRHCRSTASATIGSISQAYDRLFAGQVSEINWNDGSGPLRCSVRPMVVRDVSTDENADAWVEASAEGVLSRFQREGQERADARSDGAAEQYRAHHLD